jgi:hypothetical protein
VTHVDHGRCRSGQRWFWYAAVLDYDYPRCGDPVCEPGLHAHEYGLADTEDQALDAMADAVGRLGGGVRRGAYKNNAPGSARAASRALKRINAARRRARPPKPGAAEAAPVQHLYEPWSWTDYDYPPYETHRGKKTANRIYYDNTSRWDREDGVVTLGYIGRQDFEADTRCRETCLRDIPAGPVCGPHARGFPHCVHLGMPLGQIDSRCLRSGGCWETCAIDTPGRECAQHGYAWDHCPHGYEPDGCFHGTPAGVADLPGRHYGDEGTVYATREAAEEHLNRWEREQERKRKEAEPELRRLRMAMADAHPDRGGTNEGFMAAREAYKRALRQAS